MEVPFRSRVLLRREKLRKVGNIIIPDNAQTKHSSLVCEVLAVGEDANPRLKPGMRVRIGQYAGSWLNTDGQSTIKNEEAEMFIVNDDDILTEVTDAP